MSEIQFAVVGCGRITQRHAEHISTMARLFDREFVKAMIQNHRTRTRDEGMPLWALLNLALWYDYWIDRKSV